MNHLKLRDKLIIIYVVCVLVPVLLSNIIFYSVTTTNIKNQKTVDAHIAIENLQQEVQTVIDDAAGLAYLYYVNSQLFNHLQTDYEGPAQYVESLNEIRNVFNRSENEYQRISSSKIYTTNPTILSSAYITHLDVSDRDNAWYQKFNSHSQSTPFLYSTPSQLSLIQKLNYLGNRNYESVIKIDFNMEYISNLFTSTTFQGEIYLLDENSRVVFSNHQGHLNVNEAVYQDDLIIPARPITITIDFKSERYLKDWKVYGVMNEDAILEEVRKSGEFIVILTIINVVLPTVIIVLISRNIHGRINKILQHMKWVKGRQYDKIPFETDRDEVGQLSAEFNRMMERIDKLIDDVYVSDIQKKDLEIRQRQAQLHALHSQINPHFLFNALESIRMRSLMKGETETAKTIQNMAIIFRKSISWNQSFVTVKEELELIESFLQIQKYRFGDKLQFNIITDEKVLECKIPKMTFLPFVENASIHGIENIVGIGLVTIQAAIHQNMIQFVIRDNGNGMTEEQLDELNHYLIEDTNIGNHVGMKNVMLRLKLYYGERFTFNIQSLPQIGTTVTLIIPLMPELSEDESS